MNRMNCVVTAGPTYESLDDVRRLTNFSTGRLGTELAGFLTSHGHDVTLLIGQLATWHGERKAARVENFTTTHDLRDRLKSLADASPKAVFHAAAVSDFTFGKVWRRGESGELTEVKSGKISTGAGTLLAELVPTPKIIAELRDWFPKAWLTGWKYEVEGGRSAAIALGGQQIEKCRTDVCVVNGPAYGAGFGLARAGKCINVPDKGALFEVLEEWAMK